MPSAPENSYADGLASSLTGVQIQGASLPGADMAFSSLSSANLLKDPAG
ncbi:pentapeptide repeat-containing protein [Nonomuraea sp. NPDC005650]